MKHHQGDKRLRGTIERIGGILIEPREVLRETLAGAAGGVADLLLLLALQLVAIHLPQLVRAGWFMGQVSYLTGILTLINLIAESVVFPVGALIVGALGINSFSRGHSPGDRAFDLAALCVVPIVVLEAVIALTTALSGWQPGRGVGFGLVATGGGWFLLLLVISIDVVRREGTLKERHEEP